MGTENHSCLLLLVLSLSLRYIFHSSIFPQAHTQMLISLKLISTLIEI
jgi:hypothetical protein